MKTVPLLFSANVAKCDTLHFCEPSTLRETCCRWPHSRRCCRTVSVSTACARFYKAATPCSKRQSERRPERWKTSCRTRHRHGSNVRTEYFVRDAAELDAVIEHNPFEREAIGEEPSKLVVVVLKMPTRARTDGVRCSRGSRARSSVGAGAGPRSTSAIPTGNGRLEAQQFGPRTSSFRVLRHGAQLEYYS